MCPEILFGVDEEAGFEVPCFGEPGKSRRMRARIMNIRNRK